MRKSAGGKVQVRLGRSSQGSTKSASGILDLDLTGLRLDCKVSVGKGVKSGSKNCPIYHLCVLHVM